MPNPNTYDMKYRPNSYWGPKDLPEHFATRIKGELRKQAVVNKLEQGALVNKSDSSDSLLDEELKQVGSIHPWFMGGEYLPDLHTNEVEIARVVLKSTTMDVKSIRARRGKSRIYYCIVDEYPEYGDQFYLTKKSSIRPLTFKELINMIEKAIDGGLVGGYRDYNYYEGGCPAEEIFDFANASSVYYEELSSWYDDVNYEWLLEKQKELKEECTND